MSSNDRTELNWHSDCPPPAILELIGRDAERVRARLVRSKDRTHRARRGRREYRRDAAAA